MIGARPAFPEDQRDHETGKEPLETKLISKIVVVFGTASTVRIFSAPAKEGQTR
jgi:hypothetical protein